MRRLGRSGLKVSEIGLGCNNFGGRMDQAQSQVVVDAALDVGINFFDTADWYGATQSEVILGKALGKRRQQAVVTTKFGLQLGDDKMRKGASRRWIMRAVEDSLTRLGTDYIDLYQLHFPDPETEIDETLRALDDLVTQGKALYVGASNMAAWQIADADWTARSRGFSPFVAVQNEFSLFSRGVQAEVLPACERFGLGFVPYFPLASGMLSGKYRRGQAPPKGTRMDTTAWAGALLTDANFDRVEKLEGWAKERGHTILELAFAWLLGHSVVSSVIAGASRPEQVAANAATAGWRLTPAEVKDVGHLIA